MDKQSQRQRDKHGQKDGHEPANEIKFDEEMQFMIEKDIHAQRHT